jgi:glycosyltransferase involved in cell wall biosynthesis
VSSVPAYFARFSRNPWVVARGVIETGLAGRRLAPLIRRVRPDLVHANSVRSGLAAASSLWRSRIPLVWHVRDELPLNAVGRAVRRIAEWRADAIIVVSEAIRQNFATTDTLRARTVVIPNGINLDQQPTADVREELGLGRTTFVVGVVGQIAVWKRQMDAVEAFAHLATRVPDSHLLIVGVPRFRPENYVYLQELRDAVKRLGLGSRVSFLGHREDVLNVMAALDVLVVPSDREPFGRVVLEAMLVGRPVIGTNAGGIPHILGGDGVAGLLVDVGDVEAIAHGLVELATDQARAHRLGSAGQARVRACFDIVDVARQVDELYQQLLVQPKAKKVSVASSQENKTGGMAEEAGSKRTVGFGP